MKKRTHCASAAALVLFFCSTALALPPNEGGVSDIEGFCWKALVVPDSGFILAKKGHGRGGGFGSRDRDDGGPGDRDRDRDANRDGLGDRDRDRDRDLDGSGDRRRERSRDRSGECCDDPDSIQKRERSRRRDGSQRGLGD